MVAQLLAVLLLTPTPAAVATAGGCQLSPANAAFMQQALDGWHRVSSQALQLPEKPLPWMVLFDRICVWHLAPAEPPPGAVTAKVGLVFGGKPLVVLAGPHGGAVRLPDGSSVPAQPRANTSTYHDGRSTFFAMALPDVWRADPRYANDPTIERFFLGVMTHELVHTQHIVAIHQRLKHWAGRHHVTKLDIDDDVIQHRFENRTGFREAFEAERDLLFRAAAAADAEQRRSLTAEALSMARARHARHFVGKDRRYAELEELFLMMEGAAQWAAYRFARQANAPGVDQAALAFVRDNKKYWSQEEGLALFLLVDALVPSWQTRVLGPELASPFALLEAAVAPAKPRPPG